MNCELARFGTEGPTQSDFTHQVGCGAVRLNGNTIHPVGGLSSKNEGCSPHGPQRQNTSMDKKLDSLVRCCDARIAQASTNFAIAGEQAGFSVEQMIQMLKAGITVKALLNLIELRLGEGDASSRSSSRWIM